MVGEDVILSVTDLDALWMGTERLALAEQYRDAISKKVHELHDTYGLQQKLQSMGWVALIIAVMVLLIWGIIWLFRLWKFSITRKLLRTIKSVSIKNYPLLDTHRLGIAIIFVFNLVRLLLIFLVLLIAVPLMFSIFPETKTFTYTVFSFVWDPLTDILKSIVAYLPKLFKIAVIIFCFHYLLKIIRYFANEIAVGRLKINGFYTDWAMPTYTILRILLYSFMLVMIWPLLPSSDSEIFQGVSVFIGVIVSLGSTSVVGNVMAGLVMTYMRPFHIGDFIRFGDTDGEVIEKTILVTRIRTLKNDIITIPNSSILQAKTFNYTMSAENYGINIHTQFTMGYDINWRTCERLLVEAALATPHILHHPKPFILAHALDDSYLTYEINAYTRYSKDMLTIYSELHKNVVDKFNEAGIEVMAPHIYARRDGIRRQAPEYDDKR